MARRAAGRTTKPAQTSEFNPEQFSNYTKAIGWLNEHSNLERMRLVRYDDQTFSLDRMCELLELLGNPQRQVKCVHVAGTKGKGSTCAMLSSMLHACGYTVGLYSSPHLSDLRERLTIDGHMIPYADLTDLLRQIAQIEDQLTDPPSYFEVLTAAAFLYFAEQAVDIAVFETGLGGRLDCTNLCEPLVVGLTHISLDHTHLLGEDVATIAREKAGVMKPQVPVVSVEQDKPVVAVLKEVAAETDSPLQFTGDQIDFSWRFETSKDRGPHTRVCLSTAQSMYEHLAVPLRGEHQAHNCGLALAILDKLKGLGFDLPEAKVLDGLGKTDLPGRMEEVWPQPQIIVDGAHNGSSIQALIKALGAHLTYDSLVVIFGCAEDKEVEAMLEQLALGADKVIFTQSKNSLRAMPTEDLMSQFGEVSGKMAQSADTLPEAISLAARAVGRDDLIVVTGSFTLVGETRKYLAEKTAKAARA